jgi:hypothetical protein
VLRAKRDDINPKVKEEFEMLWVLISQMRMELGISGGIFSG